MEDDLDDTHLCIKCNATIIGIEFYISHRRRNCVIRNEQVITHAAAAKATNASDDASTATATTATATAAAAAASAASGTGAVAGVAAENSAVSTTPSAVAVVSAYDNFHQTSDSIKETQTFSPPHHDNHHHQLVHSLDADHHHHHHTRDYEYDLGADIFFSSLELCSTQSLRNHQAHPPATLITPSHPITASSPSVATAAALQAATSSASSASTLFHSRATPQTSPQVANNSGAGSGGDETAKLMSVVRAISGNRMASTTYRMLRLSQDSMAPYNCGGTAGAEKEDDDGEVDGDDDDTQENYVPSDANSTDTEEDTEYDAGVEAVQHLQHENDESEDEDSDEADEDDNEDGDAFDDHDVPPPSHTRGKWVPGSKIVRLEYKDDTVHKTTASGTGGSGISAAMPTASSDTDAQAAVANTTIASEKFHCKVCDRTLSTHISYARHLESDLHRKRSLPERELDAALRGSPRISDAELQQPQRKRVRISVDQAEAADAPKKPAKRYRRHIYIRCEVCCLRLARHMLGKHLISQYHYRHMSKKRKPYEQIFRHMPEVVRQSPFQCQPCRFYAITAAHFMLHWQSAEHAERIAAGLKSSLLWCSDCKFQCTDNAGMTAHLKGDQHQALIDMIDRSMPIIVRQKRRIACTQCGEEFQLNVQLRKHAAGSCAATPLLNAAGPEDSASDRYQSKFWCAECATLCTSQRAFQRHEILMHQRAVFFCSICDEKFGSAEAARDHRKGIQHKVLAQKRRFDAIGASAAAKVLQLKRKCRVCAVVLEDIIRLKEHLLVEHPDDFYTCLTCGFRCVLQQELSRHRRDGDCYANESAGVENEARVENETPVKNEASVENGAPVENKDESSAGLPTFHCSDCIFSCTSKADQLFHEYMHELGGDFGELGDKRLPCPRCKKSFPLLSLRMHLQQHTGERRFRCPECDVRFARKSNYRAHMRLKHSGTSSQTAKKRISSRPPDAPKQPSVKRPKKTTKETTTTKKPAAKMPAANGPVFKCPQCPFATRRKNHLKRHAIVHTDQKPYACPYCDFTCNSAENIRKHVLNTVQHRGRFLYECPHCKGAKVKQFRSNSIKPYQAHLAEMHPGNIAA